MFRRYVVAPLVLAVFALGVVSTGGAVVASAPGPQPQLITGVPGTSLLYVVATSGGTCAVGPCLRLERTTLSLSHVTTVHLPPLRKASGNLLGDLSQLTFANATDGYAALNGSRSLLWYVTTNGAESWRRIAVAPGQSIVELEATGGALYAVVAHCVKRFACSNYRIARSPLAANRWTYSALPAALSQGGFALAAYGANVWVNLSGARGPQLFISHNAGRTFIERKPAQLVSVSACDLTPESPTVLWAECPTGMLVSFFYSNDGGSSWRSISRFAFAGTGGGAFAPVSSSLAYLDFGPFTSRHPDLYLINGARGTMTPAGNLVCSSAWGLVFANASRGVALCAQNTTSTTTMSLRRTTDGGRSWTTVRLT